MSQHHSQYNFDIEDLQSIKVDCVNGIIELVTKRPQELLTCVVTTKFKNVLTWELTVRDNTLNVN